MGLSGGSGLSRGSTGSDSGAQHQKVEHCCLKTITATYSLPLRKLAGSSNTK